MVATLITHGHRDAVDYGLEFFADAYGSVYEKNLEAMRDIAVAVRAAGAEEKRWKEFFASLSTESEKKNAAEETIDTVEQLMKEFG